MQEAYAHCEALVRSGDRDRYLASLFLPPHARPHVLALYAFNVEIASVRERTREPLAGQVRLQWWRDAIAGRAAGDAARNPVAAALIDTIGRTNLPRPVLDALIEAREIDLLDEKFSTRAAFEAYLHATSSSLFELITGMLEQSGAKARTVSGLAGLAYGITGLLRALPLHASRGQVYLPADLLKEFGTARADIVAAKSTPSLAEALADLRRRARTHLADVREHMAHLPGAARPAFLPLALLDGYLERMERTDYDPFRTPVEVPQWRRQWALWRAARRGL